mmetsp:Transcript_112498/g.177047  ORF Transcript_112498/g.177047 Transcript_112498/m.177047 type:complete len:336 (+) Transcript_112498:75-1082(+)|eukprot:CAMPEP_0169119072 /NCGR_PEP_ID=MMETSP1015-20121227/31348_1 /TAXON_ID=342587 /ORGANISM="Karlodinium micrum, Strain CCMP2283" /LENGTH=335 /DNA_ID=CAMNT_0009181901 /DNA_START=66 /DNA_END=1073 /DNA_ORIENTATION=+
MTTFGNLIPPATMSTSPLTVPRYGAALQQTYAYPGNALIPQNNAKTPFGATRRRMNPMPVVMAVVFPWLLFCGVFAMLSFTLHYTRPGLCWFGVIAALLVIGICFAYAARALSGKTAGETRDPTWIIVFTGMCFIAWLLAVLLGIYNFWSCMSAHYDTMSLNTYTNVDVGQLSGSAVLDAGHITFEAGSFIDISKAVGFKDVSTYCAAPISPPISKVPGQLLTYDFWASGVNCCSGEPGDFHCGEENGKLVLGGAVRVLDSSLIAKLTLATEQAASFFKFRVGHPIFLHTTADPLSGESGALERGLKFYCLWSLIFFGVNLLFVFAVLVTFSKHL